MHPGRERARVSLAWLWYALPPMPSPPTSWTQFCPGLSPIHRYDSDGMIEVQGEGFPSAAREYPGQAALIPEVWRKYRSIIEAASAKYGVPIPWIVSLIIIESGGRETVGANSAGAVGLMQLLRSTAAAVAGRPVSDAELVNPAINIDLGTKFMASQGARYGWDLPVIAASYNAGSPKCSATTRCKSTIDGQWTFDGTTGTNSWGMVEDCTQGRSSAYARKAVALNNDAIRMGIGSSGGGYISAASLLAGVFAGIALMMWGLDETGLASDVRNLF